MGAARSSHWIEERLWRRVESLLVLLGAEEVARPSIDRLRRRRRIDFHPAHRTDRAARGGRWRVGIDGVGARIEPALALVLHRIGGLSRRFAPLGTLPHAQRAVDPRSEPPCGTKNAAPRKKRPPPRAGGQGIPGETTHSLL